MPHAALVEIIISTQTNPKPIADVLFGWRRLIENVLDPAAKLPNHDLLDLEKICVEATLFNPVCASAAHRPHSASA